MRTFNRIASLVLALVLFVLGALIIVESVLVLAGKPDALLPLDSWYRALTTTTFGNSIVLIVAIVAAVLGLLLLFGQLRPWRPVRLDVAKAGNWHLRRNQVQRSIAAAVDKVPGVSGSHARLGKRWKLGVRAVGLESDRPAVETAVTRELDRLSAPDFRRVRIRMTHPRRVV